MTPKSALPNYHVYHLKLELTHDQVIEVLLHELDGPRAVDLSQVKNSKVIHDLVKAHLLLYGLSKLRKPISADLLLRRQEVLAQTKGLIQLTGGLPIMR